ncbi:sugar ABC transporter permease [Actinocatenispora sera]|uniref:ABC transporter permease n=1 Tax=Actinocatenispora sera TaxID=390989 RepID=A0A810KYH3_9ACTN|nr:sugar ABC transporter permease [Actinocatenispora sera]BCJ28154.1 ABC transporter permease [Actinocatenispora sera]
MTTQTAPRTEPAGTGRPARASRWSRMRRSGSGIALLFVAPYLLLFLVFRIGPTLAGMALSLAKYQITGIVEWRGLSNFQRLFTDDLFWNALRVTVVYTVIAVPLTLIVALVMAQLSARSIRGIRVYRALYFLPVITSLVTSGVIWQWLYAEHGPLNGLFGLLGIGPVPWLSSGAAVLPSLSLLSVWTRFGYDMLILLAGLLAIPKEYTEAAMLDGASAWQRFWHITLPQLKPAMFFVVILEIVQSFQVFDVIYVMTGGGPVRSSYSLVFFVYDQGFHYFDFGYASAAGVVLFAITLVVSLVQRRLFRED